MSSIKERSILTLDSFLGVDFTTSPLKVDSRRAVSGVNFMTDYGTLKKRPGWIEQVKFANEKITGMFRYTDFTIVRAGDHIYKLNDDMTYTTLYTIEATDNENIHFFVMNSNVYIVGLGVYLFMHQVDVIDNKPVYEIDRVEDYATIPTTTISIDDIDSEDINKTLLQPINLLTRKRKNTLLGRDAINLTWQLDGSIATEGGIPKEVFVDIEYFDSTLGTKKYKTFPLENGSEIYLFDQEETDFIADNRKGELIKQLIETTYTFYWKQVLSIPSHSTVLNYDYTDSGITGNPTVDDIEEMVPAKSFLQNTYIKYTNELGYETYFECLVNISKIYAEEYTRIKIYEATPAPVEGADNITVTYQTSELPSHYINRSNNGIIFGSNGTTNILFLAYKGYEYYSKAYDFNYFPDIQTNELGNAENPIMGYARTSDTSLVIYKGNDTYESRIFVRTMELSANSSTLETEYTLYDQAVDVGVGCDAPKSIANLNGDNLFLSKSGLFALTLGSNITVSSRHVKERSMYVNKKMLEEAIEIGVAIVFDSRYYIAFDGDVYVADARYTSSSDLSDTFNYEFFYWENIPVTAWLVKDNELWFGTEEGRLCKFDDEFSDRTLIKASEGDVTLVVNDNHLVYNQSLSIKENDEIYANCYEEVLSNSQISSVISGLITSSLEDVEHFLYEGQTIYIKDINSNLVEETPYTIYGLSINEFYLKDSNGEVINNITGNFDIIINLLNHKMFVTNLDIENSKFQLKSSETGNSVKLVSYTLDPITFTIIVHEAVEMVWYSPIFDLGTNLYSKTLFAMTVSADASTKGEIDFGFDTRNISSNIQSLNYQEFTFDDIDFNNFTFLTAIASSYTKRVKEKDFNFIILKFGSKTRTSAVINSCTIMYKINQMNKGIR